MPTAPSIRYHDLDLLRASLMVLGIVYHAALLFAPEGAWKVVSDAPALAFLVFADFLHAWRMPTFFVIAGFFAVLLVKKKGPAVWFRGRLARLGMPLLFGLLIVVPISVFVRNYLRLGSSEAATDEWIRKAILPGGMVEHLWFLIALLMFCGVFAALVAWPAARRLASRGVDRVESASEHPWVPPVVAVLVGIAVAAALGVWSAGDVETLTWGLLTYHVAYYAPFFVAGAVIAGRESIRRRFVSRPGPATFVVAAVSCGIFAFSGLLPTGQALQISRAVVVTIAGLYGARVLFWLAGRLLTRSSAVVGWLTSSAMLIYILHQPVLLVTALLVFPVRMPSVLAFTTVVVITFVLSALLSEVLMTWKPIRFVTTGTTKRGVSLVSLLSIPGQLRAAGK